MLILGLVLIGLVVLLFLCVAMLFVRRKPTGSVPPAPPAAPSAAPCSAPVPGPQPVLSHRQQVVQDETLALIAAYQEAEAAKFRADTIVKFRSLVPVPPVVVPPAA